jgi:hypothetical protein
MEQTAITKGLLRMGMSRSTDDRRPLPVERGTSTQIDQGFNFFFKTLLGSGRGKDGSTRTKLCERCICVRTGMYST